jgi:hypothetical protein
MKPSKATYRIEGKELVASVKLGGQQHKESSLSFCHDVGAKRILQLLLTDPQPSFAKATATARPITLSLPVMMATLFFSFPSPAGGPDAGLEMK